MKFHGKRKKNAKHEKKRHALKTQKETRWVARGKGKLTELGCTRATGCGGPGRKSG